MTIELEKLVIQIKKHKSASEANRNKMKKKMVLKKGSNPELEKDWAFFSGEASAFDIILTYLKDLQDDFK